MKRKAECCCGKCVVVVNGDPSFHGICHCDNCKKRTGSAFGISAYFPCNKFEHVSGNTSVYEVTNNMGAQQRHFCGRCGTTLFWFVEVFKNKVGVAGGCFMENPLPAPKFSVMHENRCTWLKFDETINTEIGEKDLPRI